MTNEQYVYVDGQLAIKRPSKTGGNEYEMLPVREVNWTKTARKTPGDRAQHQREVKARNVNATIIIKIGRNKQDGTTLSAMDWRLFQGAVEDIMFSLSGVKFSEFQEGVGHWSKGSEENYTVTIVSTDPITNEDELKNHLSELCSIYDQKNIALTIGTTELIG